MEIKTVKTKNEWETSIFSHVIGLSCHYDVTDFVFVAKRRDRAVHIEVLMRIRYIGIRVSVADIMGRLG